MLSRRVTPMTDFAYLFEQMDRMAQDALGGSPRARVATLPVDIYDQGEELIVQAFVPGIHAESLDITIDDGVVTIAGSFPALRHGRGGRLVLVHQGASERHVPAQFQLAVQGRCRERDRQG